MKKKIFLLALLFSPLHVWSGHGQEGGDAHTIVISHVDMLKLTIQHKLKADLAKLGPHLENLLSEDLGLPPKIIDQLHKVFNDPTTTFYQDVEQSLYSVQSDPCYDRNGVPRSATAKMDQLSGKICFSTSQILLQGGIDYSQLVGLTFHEHAHHFGVLDRDSKSDRQPLAELAAQTYIEKVFPYAGQNERFNGIEVLAIDLYESAPFCGGFVRHGQHGVGYGIWPKASNGQLARPCRDYQNESFRSARSFLFFKTDVLFSPSKVASIKHYYLTDRRGNKMGLGTKTGIGSEIGGNERFYAFNICQYDLTGGRASVELQNFEHKCQIIVDRENMEISLTLGK